MKCRLPRTSRLYVRLRFRDASQIQVEAQKWGNSSFLLSCTWTKVLESLQMLGTLKIVGNPSFKVRLDVRFWQCLREWASRADRMTFSIAWRFARGNRHEWVFLVIIYNDPVDEYNYLNFPKPSTIYSSWTFSNVEKAKVNTGCIGHIFSPALSWFPLILMLYSNLL